MKDAIRENNRTYIDINASTNKQNNSIKGYNKWRKRIKINLRAKSKKNKANKELKKYLSHLFSISKEKIEITKGMTQNKKTIALDDVTKKEVLSKLSKELNE